MYARMSHSYRIQTLPPKLGNFRHDVTESRTLVKLSTKVSPRTDTTLDPCTCLHGWLLALLCMYVKLSNYFTKRELFTRDLRTEINSFYEMDLDSLEDNRGFLPPVPDSDEEIFHSYARITATLKSKETMIQSEKVVGENPVLKSLQLL